MLKRFLRRKPPSSLKQALRHLHAASNIVLRYKRNKHHIPTEKDLALLRLIEESAQEAYGAASYAHRCLTQRKNGEPEGAKKFTDKEVFNWHYPDS